MFLWKSVSPELGLTKPIFYALCGICILAVYIGEFHSDFMTFETFKMQKVDDMTVLQFRRSGSFEPLPFTAHEYPPFSPAKIPNCHNMHQFHLVIDGPGMNTPRKRKRN
jgi:hypothetical protein